jgi:hypothetical protein
MDENRAGHDFFDAKEKGTGGKEEEKRGKERKRGPEKEEKGTDLFVCFERSSQK